MNVKKSARLWCAVIYALFVLGNYFLNRGLWPVDLYALLLGESIILFSSWENAGELLYYLALLFAVMDFTFNLPLLGRYNIYYLHITLLILVLQATYSALRGRRRRPRIILSNKYAVFLAAFVIYLLISLAWARDRGAGVRYGIDYGIMLSFLWMVYRFNPTSHKVKESLKVLFWSSIGVLAIGCIEITGVRLPVRNIFTDNRLYELPVEYLRHIPTVFFYNPNNYAVYLVMAGISLLVWLSFTRGVSKWALLGLLYGACLVNLIAASSRTNWITLFAALAGLIAVLSLGSQKRERRNMLILAVFSLLVFYGLSQVDFFGPFFGKFVSTFKGQAPSLGGGGSLSERYTIAVDLITGVLAKGHLLGFGVGNSPAYLATLKNTHGITNPHSLWLELLGDFGIFMLAYIVVIYTNLLVDLYKLYRRSSGFLSVLALGLLANLGAFVLSSFAPSSVISFAPFWFLLGLSARLVTGRGGEGNAL